MRFQIGKRIKASLRNKLEKSSFQELRKSTLKKISSGQILQLETKDEIEIATEYLEDLGLPGHHDRMKNWDLSLSVNACMELDRGSRVLDAGSGSKAVFASSMHKLGFVNAYACDFQKISCDNVYRETCDIIDTPYPDSFFSAIACLSVIEHGVDLKLFAKEMNRIAKLGCKLLISTDFWPEPEDYSDRFPYGLNNPPMKLFNNSSVREFIDVLELHGWSVPEFENFMPTIERPIHWERMNASYTFLWFEVTKIVN